jgi:threonine/homoserine/homoserine lactone efflux protein
VIQEIAILVKGIVLGIAIAAPVGPIGLLCINRTVERGIAAGLATGLGAAIADALFSAIAAFGVTAIVEELLGRQGQLKVVGGLFLLGVAIHAFLKEPRPPASTPDASNLPAAVASGLILTATNPVTIMGIMALVVGLGGNLGPAQAATLVAGIFIGSTLWWTALCGGVSLVRHKVTLRTAHWLNRGTGVVIGLLGLWALWSAAFGAEIRF